MRFAAHQRSLIIRQRFQVRPFHQHPSGRRHVNAAQHRQQRALTGARWSHDGHQLATPDLQINAAQHFDPSIALTKIFGQAFDFNDFHVRHSILRN